MAKRTWASCWKQYEKLSQVYLSGKKDLEETQEKLDELSVKANNDDIGGVLSAIFVKPYYPNPVTVLFTTRNEDGVPRWQTTFDEENEVMELHPVSVFRFYNEIRALTVPNRDEADLIRCRNLSFLSEISKLNSDYFAFLIVLQRVAYLLEIAHLEKRGGIIEVAEGESYHTLLWAFKELEIFARRSEGLNLRAHYGISWYEADWITGR